MSTKLLQMFQVKNINTQVVVTLRYCPQCQNVLIHGLNGESVYLSDVKRDDAGVTMQGLKVKFLSASYFELASEHIVDFYHESDKSGISEVDEDIAPLMACIFKMHEAYYCINAVDKRDWPAEIEAAILDSEVSGSVKEIVARLKPYFGFEVLSDACDFLLNEVGMNN